MMELARGIEPPTCGLQNRQAPFMEPFEKDANPRVNIGEEGDRSLPAFTAISCHSLSFLLEFPYAGHYVFSPLPRRHEQFAG